MYVIMLENGRKAFTSGGFRNSITENKVFRYVNTRGPKITKVSVFKSNKYDAAVVRLNVEDDMNVALLDDPLFWPEGVVCRPWVSKVKSKRSNRAPRFNRRNGVPSSLDKTDIVKSGSYSNNYNPYSCLSSDQWY
jgi:hypothetical protein